MRGTPFTARQLAPQLVAALLIASAGCNGGLFGDTGSTGPEPGEDCSGEGLPADATGLPIRAVTLGEGTTDASFQAWVSGQSVSYDTGGQGFTMITPYLRLESDGSDADDMCVRVQLEHWNTDGTPFGDGETGGPLIYSDHLVFRQSGAHHFAGPLFDVMYEAPENHPLELRAHLVGPDFAAEGTVDVVLVY